MSGSRSQYIQTFFVPRAGIQFTPRLNVNYGEEELLYMTSAKVADRRTVGVLSADIGFACRFGVSVAGSGQSRRPGQRSAHSQRQPVSVAAGQLPRPGWTPFHSAALRCRLQSTGRRRVPPPARRRCAGKRFVQLTERR